MKGANSRRMEVRAITPWKRPSLREVSMAAAITALSGIEFCIEPAREPLSEPQVES